MGGASKDENRPGCRGLPLVAMGASPSVLHAKITMYGNERETRLEQFDAEREARIVSHEGNRSERLAKYSDDRRERLQVHEENLNEIDALHDKLALFESKLEEHIERFVMPEPLPDHSSTEQTSDQLDEQLGMGVSAAAGGIAACKPADRGQLHLVRAVGCQSSTWQSVHSVDDRVLYATGTAIVLQQVASADQQFYAGHVFPVECIAVAPDMQSVASITFSDQEQLQIQVWDATSLQLIHSVSWPGNGGRPRAMAFNGNCLAVVAADRSVMLGTVTDPSKRPERIRAAFALSCCSWTSNGNLWAGGNKAVVVWPPAAASSRTQVGEMVVGRCEGAVRAVCALAADLTGIISGSDRGSLQLWNRVTAGLDQMVRVWTVAANKLLQCSEFGLFSLGAPQLLDSAGRPLLATNTIPVHLSLSNDSQQVAIGTNQREVIELDLSSSSVQLVTAAVTSCHTQQIVLVCCDELPMAVTAGFELKTWHLGLHDESPHTHCTANRWLENPASAVDITCDGALVVIGTRAGAGLVLFDGETLHTKFKVKHRNSDIAVVRFSADTLHLAAASSDGFVDVYSVEAEANAVSIRRTAVCTGASNCVLLDWSFSSLHLRGCDAAGTQMRVWAASNGSKVDLQDAEVLSWASHHVVAAARAPERSGDTTETTCAAVWQAADTEDESATTMMVAGSSTGQVTIWTSEQSDGQSCSVHTGPVSAVSFTFDQSHVVSVGQTDQLLLLWRCDGVAPNQEL